MDLKVQGTLHRIFEPEQRSEKFTRRDFVLEIPDGQYPQLAKFQLTQDRCGLLDNHREGEQVTVHFDIRGREWNGKYLTDLNAWKITGEGTPPERPVPPAQPSESNQATKAPAAGDNLPF